MSFTESTSEVKRGKKVYKITKKTYKTEDRRRATMRSEYIKKDKFLVGVKLPTDFKCEKCEKEIDSHFVFITLTDSEMISVIRTEKLVYHRDCISYSLEEPIIGILPLVEERQAFELRGKKPLSPKESVIVEEPELEMAMVEDPEITVKKGKKYKKTTKKKKGK